MIKTNQLHLSSFGSTVPLRHKCNQRLMLMRVPVAEYDASNTNASYIISDLLTRKAHLYTAVVSSYYQFFPEFEYCLHCSYSFEKL